MSDPDNDPPPRHPFELVIRASGFTWAECLANASEMRDHVASHGPTCSLVGGSGYVSVERREVTRDAYEAELSAWLERRRVARAEARA